MAFHVRELASSPPDLELTNVVDLDLDSEGRIYVGDFGRSAVIVLSDRGAQIRAIGRRGQGPGEFNTVTNVQVLPGDSLLVFDGDLNRVTVFAPGSDSVAYILNLSSISGTAPYWMRKIPDAGAYAAAYRASFRASGTPEDDRNRVELLRVLNDDGSVRTDSLLRFPGRDFLVARERGRVMVGPNPFGRQGIVAVGPRGRIHFGWTDSLQIQIYDLNGRRTETHRFRYNPAPVTSADLAKATSTMQAFFAQMLRELAPETWPAFDELIVDDHGRSWIATPDPRDRSTRRWLVLNESGDPLGWVSLPANMRIQLIRDERAYAVETSDLGVPRLVVLRLEERAPAG